MVQIIPKARSFGEEFAQALGSGFSGFLEERAKRQQAAKASDFLGMDVSGYDPETIKGLMVEKLKQQGKEARQQQEQRFLSRLFPKNLQAQQDSQILFGQQEDIESPGTFQERMASQEFDPSQISDEDILQATAINPNLGKVLESQKDAKLREKREEKKEQRTLLKEEREYHTSFSREAEKEADLLRTAIPKKEMALNFARDAVETGDVSYFSLDKLADITGSDLFRTAKGAQLVTAGKENLLSNMARVSSKAQNIWFEQRLNSMFPKIGQSQEANLTIQEMLESEASMDRAYLNAFDRLAEEDMEKYDHVRKDIKKRAQKEVDPIQKEIFNRTSYRMKELEEKEKGLTAMQKQVGKKVPKGTPLTLAMAKLYKDKFGNDALKVAEKAGYYVPTLEEFQKFQISPREFREEL